MANFWDEFDDELFDDEDEFEFDEDEDDEDEDDEDEDCIMDEDDAMIANCWAKVAQQAQQALSRCDGCGGEDCACCEVFVERQSYLTHEMAYENGWY